MTNKSQELELRAVMEGLEEFATFMSYKSDYQHLRILSVETVEQDKQKEQHSQLKADVIPIDSARTVEQEPASTYHKSLKFFDKVVH